MTMKMTVKSDWLSLHAFGTIVRQLSAVSNIECVDHLITAPYAHAALAVAELTRCRKRVRKGFEYILKSPLFQLD